MKSQPPLNVVSGLPDDRMVAVSRLTPSGIEFITPGTQNFLDQIGDALAWHRIWLGPGAPERVEFGPGPIVNYMADPDVCQKALHEAALIAKRVDRPWFNHPDGVLRTSRDKVSALLQRIDGLDVPAVIRLKPQSSRSIVDAIETTIGFPALVRPVGRHGGEALVRLERADDEPLLYSLPFGGRELYATAYREFADPDGLYRKYRIAVVAGTPYLRHVIVGSSWLLHAERRLWDLSQAEEERRLRAFPSELRPRVEPVVREIARRLNLDYFGIDCALRPDGRFILFEANGCMDILRNSRPSPNVWDAPIAEIRTALLELLATPDRWIKPDVNLLDEGKKAFNQAIDLH